MKTNFIFLIFTAAFIAVTMGSCGKDEEPLKELEITLNDNTEISVTVQITDCQTGKSIAGAVIKDDKGATVATTDANGMATCTKKAGDKPVYMIEAAGYAPVWDEIFGEFGIICISKSDAKLRGVATYTNKSGALSVVPSGTDITIFIGSRYIQKEYTVKAGAEGIFEFSGLPYGAYCDFFQITIGSDKYRASEYSYGVAGISESLSIQYLYISDELPLAIVSHPGSVTPTGDIVIKFTKAIDAVYSDISAYYHPYSNYSAVFSVNVSSDKKTLTLTPDSGTPWGKFYTWDSVITFDNVNVSISISTPVNNVTGRRESVYKSFRVQVVG